MDLWEVPAGRSHSRYGNSRGNPSSQDLLSRATALPLCVPQPAVCRVCSLLKDGQPGNGGRLGLFLDLFEITPQINRLGNFLVDGNGLPLTQVPSAYICGVGGVQRFGSVPVKIVQKRSPLNFSRSSTKCDITYISVHLKRTALVEYRHFFLVHKSRNFQSLHPHDITQTTTYPR